jgi:Na+/H+ antiporter NhaD/arsenite permease-like protein
MEPWPAQIRWQDLAPSDLPALGDVRPVALRPTTLLRSLRPAFWIALLIFLAVLGLMATGKQHSTLAALVGVASLFGISTLIGTPTNILIGSYAGISFGGFLLNRTPGVLLAMVGLIVNSEWQYRRELGSRQSASPELLQQLIERARIRQPGEQMSHFSVAPRR